MFSCEKLFIKRFLRRTCEAFGCDKLAHPALNSMDKNIIKYLPDNPGIFIEAGANNGYSQSNTYYLERFKGWKGILIEPIPELFRECVKERKKSKVFNCALVADDYEKDFVEIHSASLMSVIDGVMDKAEQAAHLKKAAGFERNLNVKLIKVPARTLTSIIEECRIDRIDFLSLDVEGYEPEVLQGLNFDKLAPELILAESNRKEEMDCLLLDKYDIVEIFDLDVLYKKKLAVAP